MEVEAAVALRERWERRADAVTQLENIIVEVWVVGLALCPPSLAAREIQAVHDLEHGRVGTVGVQYCVPCRAFCMPHNSACCAQARVAMCTARQVRAPLVAGQEGPAETQAVLSDRAARLEAAIEAARSTNISVSRAKRLHKELQAQAAAAAASLVLGEAVAEAAAPTAAAQLSHLQVHARAHGCLSSFTPE